jgi:glucan phosphorylase
MMTFLIQVKISILNFLIVKKGTEIRSLSQLVYHKVFFNDKHSIFSFLKALRCLSNLNEATFSAIISILEQEFTKNTEVSIGDVGLNGNVKR